MHLQLIDIGHATTKLTTDSDHLMCSFSFEINLLKGTIIKRMKYYGSTDRMAVVKIRLTTICY